MFTIRKSYDPKPPLIRRSAFTLVEMMVAVALVLLMMTMFAEIFTLATGSMGKQKALGELDQRQRMVSTIIRNDLKHRTFKYLFAIHPAELTSTIAARNGRFGIQESGYFYISENDPDNDGDDVIQWTVRRPDDDQSSLFYGKTVELFDAGFPGGMPPPPPSRLPQGVYSNPNQPQVDDGTVDNTSVFTGTYPGTPPGAGTGTGVGSSPCAEVAIFLRNGVLYRRTLLVRVPPDLSDTDQPSTFGGGTSLIQSGIYPVGSGTGGTVYAPGGSGRFPVDFDYSARYDYGAPNYAGTNQVTFLGNSALSNRQGASVPVPPSLGLPNCRFGFRPTPFPAASRPYEYLLPSGEFIGRFTHGETSHSAFAYPGDPGWGGDQTYGNADDTNPYTRADLGLSPSGVVTMGGTPMSGPRQGQDILLTNVLSFDVKVFDNALGQFVDLGHSGATGEYAQGNNRNPAYGPNPSGGNRCFDTWHPNLNPLGATPYVISNPAPFRPVGPGPDGLPGVATDGLPVGTLPGQSLIGDDDRDGVKDNPEELGWPGSDDAVSPLRAIQIRIRYREQSSGMARDITIMENMLPD